MIQRRPRPQRTSDEYNMADHVARESGVETHRVTEAERRLEAYHSFVQEPLRVFTSISDPDVHPPTYTRAFLPCPFSGES
jgi:hypothetical protein